MPAGAPSRPSRPDRTFRRLVHRRIGGMTILLVEHGVRFLPGLMDHVIVLDFGSGIEEPTPVAVPRNAVA